MTVSRISAALALAAFLLTAHAAPGMAQEAPAPEAAPADTPLPDTAPAASIAADTLRLLAEPAADGLAQPIVVLRVLKEFLKSGRAYEDCGVSDADRAMDRTVDALLDELQAQAGAGNAEEAALLRALVDKTARAPGAAPEPLPEGASLLGDLRAFYARIAEPLGAAADAFIGGLYRGSAAEEGVAWSNEQVADACKLIAGYLAAAR